ncbi:MAG: hypothetical protein HFH37_05815 [Lachnospiraceae bacterium]|nr:hypothetical protein [Lachnospiraceae bacterium]
MKKWRYSAGMKAVILVAHQCLVIVLSLCLMVLLMLFVKNIWNFSEKRDIPYEDTSYFTNQFETMSIDLLEFIDLRRKFETNGSYNADKEVDIWQYYDNQEVTGDVKKRKNLGKLAYRLGDLAEWSRYYNTQPLEFTSECYLDHGIQQNLKIFRDGESVFSEEKAIHSLEDLSPSLRDRIIEEVEHYYGGSYSTSEGSDDWAALQNTDQQKTMTASSVSAQTSENETAYSSAQKVGESEADSDVQGEQIIEKVLGGELYDLNEEELQWLLNDMDMTYSMTSYSFNYIEEDYLPIDGNGIWEMFLQGKCSLEYLQNACQALEYTLENINDEISRYRKGAANYNQEAGTSNIYYWVVRGRERKFYTNIKDSMGMDLLTFGKKIGKYMIYRESDAHLETNVGDLEEFFYEQIEPNYVNKENILYIGVDTSFSHDDSFKEAKQEYSRLHPWIRICLWGAVASFLLEGLCLIYLSIAAGKRDDSGEVHLNLVDRIPSEILFLFSSVFIVVFIFGLGSVWEGYDGGDFVSLLFLSCGIVFLGAAILLIFYLSFIRRIRAGVLWRHSIMRWFTNGIGLLFTTRKSCTKMVVWFALHLLACLCILPMISLAYDGMILSTGAALFAILCGVEAVIIIREGVQRNKVMEGISKISEGDLEYKIAEQELRGDNKRLAQAVNAIGEGLHRAVDESMKNERLQADLITNVSHDIKTPLTSIINYVDLLKREDLQNERAQNYIKVLDSKSQRLKQLAEDLVEASRISSGNINLEMVRINLVELVHQTEGEFAERFEERGLTVVSKLPGQPVVVLADGRRIWRVLENLYQNVAKYAMEHTRVYVDLQADGEKVIFSIKNISKYPLNIEADELTERFIRGDVSRSTEGSGLGLSIAQNLTTLMGGNFQIYLDGDLFKVMIEFQQEQ